MRGSFLEMVLAIAIAGLVFTSAIVPTVKMVVAYQASEADLNGMTTQSLAGVRAAQIAGAVWRDDPPPDGHAALLAADADRFQVGTWEWRAHGERLEQRHGGSWGTLSGPVNTVSLEYLLTSGAWVTSAAGPDLDAVLALRLSWRDSAAARPHGTAVVLPDRAFSSGLIHLPAPDTASPYDRNACVRQLSFQLGSWR